MDIIFFEANNCKFYKLSIKPPQGRESEALDTIHNQVQKFITEHKDMRYNIYTSSNNRYLKMIEFYK